ncbi:MAG: DUF4105 domain-containing protein [Ferruginibacter sp.]|nr:DUF4105 domain-containing protein [Ferruginibacter sp.]
MRYTARLTPRKMINNLLRFFIVPFVNNQDWNLGLRRSAKVVLLRICLLVCLVVQVSSISAQDSSHIRISLLTCTPGEELYSTFGHTAIRVTDSSSLNDIVFNYGTFNFEDPSFYTKFIRGKLLYYLSAEKFEDFKYDYEASGRGITEQLLNLDAEEKIRITEALYLNIKPENSTYKYDFFFDNCTTRPRDLLVRSKKNVPAFKAVMPEGTRFRQAIHQYLDQNGKPWSKLGIDLLLGLPTDAIMSVTQSQFLPDNLMKTLDSSNEQREWVVSSKELFPYTPPSAAHSIFTPLVVFSLIAVAIFLLSLSANPKLILILQGFDGLLFFLTGAIGVLLIFMWAGTDHAMCKYNHNLLWALPTHLVMSFFLRSSKSWVKKYFAITAILGVLLLVSWFFLPQELNNAFLPLLLLLIYRSYQYSSSEKKALNLIH